MTKVEAISKLLDDLEEVVVDQGASEGEAIERLVKLIDTILLEAQSVSFTFDPREYPEPPTLSRPKIRATIGERFPVLESFKGEELGSYKSCFPDPVGDLEETLEDLGEIRWRLAHTSTADALFYFQLGYRSHWGRHARALQLYIHDAYW